jgi:hypothetical protein
MIPAGISGVQIQKPAEGEMVGEGFDQRRVSERRGKRAWRSLALCRRWAAAWKTAQALPPAAAIHDAGNSVIAEIEAAALFWIEFRRRSTKLAQP